MFKTVILRFLTYFFIVIIAIQKGYSQTHIYQNFDVDDGLPSSEVYDIYQDKQGYIWLATDKGLSRYNGYEFENFTTNNGLPGNTVLDFYPQKDGRVFCYEYHSQSLFYFNEVFDGFHTYQFNAILKKNLNPKSVLKSIVFDTDGNLYAGGYSLKGFIKISTNGTANKYFDLDSYEKKENILKGANLGLSESLNSFFYVNHNYPSEKDISFLNLKNGLSSRLDFAFLDKNHTVFIDKKLGILNKNGAITYYETEQFPIGIKKIDNSTFFVGYYSNGAEIRNVSGKIIEKFLPQKSVSSFLIDVEGGYWFTTLDNGVFYIKNPSIKSFTKQHISSLVKDNHNKLYLGLKNGNIGCINDKTIKILYNGLSTDAALVEFDSKENCIYGFGDGYLKNYSNGKTSYFLTANKLPENMEDDFIASSTHTYYKRKEDTIQTYKLDYKIQDVCYYNNTLLLATSSGLFVKKNDSIVRSQQNNILKYRIDDIDVDKNNNNIYMATQGSGVIFYGDSIFNITKENGLTNNIINEIHIENDSTIWACSNTGLNRITFKPNKAYTITTITKADGLLSNDIDDVEIVNDTVWIATKKGLCFFSNKTFQEKSESKVISLTLKNVRTNETVIKKDKTQLSYHENNINFTVEAISQKYNSDITYWYRLREIDTTWTSTKNREINFPSLSPRKYTFQVKSSIPGTTNNQEISYKFEILPPFWRSWWFYSICVLFFLGLIYLFFKVSILTYNQDIARELMRLVLQKLKSKEQYYNFKSNGEDFKIPTKQILYVNSQGNYLDIVTTQKSYTIRCKIGDFIGTTPDSLEYLRIHRSYIIRIDQVASKGKNWVVINEQRIPVGETYLHQLEKLEF